MSATNVARAGKRGNICVRNNVSATLCLVRLSPPLYHPETLFWVVGYFRRIVEFFMTDLFRKKVVRQAILE